MTLETMLAGLTPSEKLAAMEILWRDLSAVPSDYVSPDWHGEVLKKRIAQPSPNAPLPLDAAIEVAKERLDARRSQG